MIKYKLTNQYMRSYKEFQWTVGVEQIITKPGNTLCTDEVFHFYDSSEEAALYNPIHANINNPVCWEVDCDEVVNDGTKGGAKRMTLVKKITLPLLTIDMRIRIAIRCVMLTCKDDQWLVWANNWLSGQDRSAAAAEAASWAARKAAEAAGEAADASWAASWAAREAAEAASWAAREAAEAAAAARAAEAASWAAREAAEAAMDTIQQIKNIIKEEINK